MSSKVKKKILKLKESSTLVINEKSKELISNGKKVYQFGFGQSPFPVPEKIVEALKKNAHRKEYLPIQGLPELRENISKYLFKRTGNDYPKENILITPGSKEAMLLIHIAFNGEIIIQNVALMPKQSFSKTGKVVDSEGNGIPNCNLMISSNFFKDSLTTNQFGEFILDTLYQSDYTIYYGKWGYRTKCEVKTLFSDSLPLLLDLER